MTVTPETEILFGEGVVALARREGIATVTLNRPAQHNAISSLMWRGLGEVVQAADADPAVGVIVLRGAGQRAFMEKRRPRFNG